MKYISVIFFAILFTACSSNKTVFVSNKLNKPITLSIDSTYISAQGDSFKDSLDNKKVEKSLVINFGKGKWSKKDKSDLEKLFKNSKIIEDATKKEMQTKIKVRHISLNVEELWVIIKRDKNN
ncbi:hypothetical protein [Nonlabens ulvanivorans]|uniref:hypothetical protein n=1 Tax=Nonlabens ulvanivorans TaxID=906888 RepID=UPI003264A598